MAGVGGASVCEAIGASSMFRLIRRDVSLTRMLSTLDLIDLSWEEKEVLWKRNWSWLCCE